MQIPVFVLTCDRYLWAVRGFAYFFNLFWSELQPVVVGGFSQPDFELPPNFTYHSITDHDYPKEKWSDGLIEFIESQPDDLFVLMLEDYWLSRKADNAGVASLADYMAMHPDVLRLDLTTDRLYAGGMFDVEAWGHYDIVETPAGTPYQISTQAGIWRKGLILQTLKRGVTGWQYEIDTQPPASMRVLGTRQSPVRYANVFQGGNPDKLLNLEQLPQEHVEELRGRGWLR